MLFFWDRVGIVSIVRAIDWIERIERIGLICGAVRVVEVIKFAIELHHRFNYHVVFTQSVHMVSQIFKE